MATNRCLLEGGGTSRHGRNEWAGFVFGRGRVDTDGWAAEWVAAAAHLNKSIGYDYSLSWRGRRVRDQVRGQVTPPPRMDKPVEDGKRICDCDDVLMQCEKLFRKYQENSTCKPIRVSCIQIMVNVNITWRNVGMDSLSDGYEHFCDKIDMGFITDSSKKILRCADTARILICTFAFREIIPRTYSVYIHSVHI